MHFGSTLSFFCFTKKNNGWKSHAALKNDIVLGRFLVLLNLQLPLASISLL